MRQVIHSFVHRLASQGRAPLVLLILMLAAGNASAQDIDLNPVQGAAPDIKEEAPNAATLNELDVPPTDDEGGGADGGESADAGEAAEGEGKTDKKAKKEKKPKKAKKEKRSAE
jgi:hypothetical protein